MSPPRVFGLRQTGSVATAIISPAKNIPHERSAAQDEAHAENAWKQ
jgi:hypothetical protein